MRILANLTIAGTLDIDTVLNANADTDRFLVQESNGLVRFRTGAEVLSDIGGVSTGRTLTINGVTYNLSADRTWTIAPGGTTGQILAKNSATNYDWSWIDNYTSDVRQNVKAAEAISKGQAVYVSGADGTNILVSKASNTSEATSSKTLGLLYQSLALNGQGFVITEGLLSGLDTSTATVGDPVWLGTNGNLIYGLANKPYAPAHLVYLGVVTRVNLNNGEIFVHVQNGFELQELHNVQITSAPADNTVLSYETSSSLYKMKSIPTLLGYTPANQATTLTINGTTFDLSANRTWNVGTTTGTGSAGQVAFWTGSNTQSGDNGLYWDNTNKRLGIGTTGGYSASKLLVSGGSATGGIVTEDSSGVGSFIRILGDVTNGNLINYKTGTALRFATSDASFGSFSERMRLDATGNLGIGTTSPQRRLHVANSIMLSSASAAQELLIGDDNVRYFSLQTPSGAANLQFNVYGGANIMTLTSGQRLLLGTTTDNGTDRLQVSGSASITGELYLNAPSSNANIILKRSTSYEAGLYFLNSSTFQWNISADTSNNLKFSKFPGGFADILTLASSGAATFSSSVTAGGQLTIAYANPDVDGIKLQATTGTNAASIMITNAGGNFYIGKDKSDGSRISGTAYANAIWAENSNPLVFGVNNGEKLRITSGGNVGIGTTSPTATLDVYKGTQSNTISLANSTAWLRGVDVGLAIGQDNGAGGYGTWIQSIRTDNTSFSLSINPNGGNVKIGTLTDNGTDRLQVSGSAKISGNTLVEGSNPYLRLNDTSGSAAGSIQFYNNGTQKFNLTTLATSNNFALYNNGGTNSYNLTIEYSSGAATFSSSVTATSIIKSGGTSAQILAADGSVITAGTNITISGGTISASLSGALTGSGTTNYLPKWTGVTTLGNSIIQDNGSTVTVGGTIGVSTSGQSIAISSFYGAGSDGRNIFIGGGGLSSGTGGGSSFLGSGNVSFGYNALVNNTTGFSNTAIGTTSLQQNTTGYANVAIGINAGGGTGATANTTGYNNIFIGNGAIGVSATDNNRTFIGNSSTTSTWLGGRLLLGSTTDDGINELQVTGSGVFTEGIEYRVLKPSNTVSGSLATLTPNLANGDTFIITAQNAALSIAAPTGTFVNGQKLLIRIKDNGTARALTWTTTSGGYRASSDLSLPTTTTANRTMYLGFIWHSNDSRWDLIAFLNNFT